MSQKMSKPLPLFCYTAGLPQDKARRQTVTGTAAGALQEIRQRLKRGRT